MRERILVLGMALLAPLTLTSARADVLTVVLYNDLDIDGDMNAPWSEADEQPDHLASSNGQATYLVRTVKAHLRHFLARTETHGLDVRVTAVASRSGITSPCEQRVGEANLVYGEHDPDVVVPLGNNMECFVEELATLGVMSIGLLEDAPADLYTDQPGMVWSFAPDLDQLSYDTATFICRSLWLDANGESGAPARYAFDPDLRGRARRFGLIYPVSNPGTSRGQQPEIHAEALQSLTRSTCGLRWGQNGPNFVAAIPESGAGTLDAPFVMSRFKSNGVTTVLCICVPVMTEMTTTKMTAAARLIGYYPEYVSDHVNRMDKPVWQRYYGPRMPESSFGITPYWLMPALEQQEHYQAYLSQEPGTTPNERFSFDIYWGFWTLFTAIQRSGGDLTPVGVSDALLGYELRPDDPTLVSGGFTGENPYTFLDGSMAWWFDPTGEEPGVDLPIGCNRATGARARRRLAARRRAPLRRERSMLGRSTPGRSPPVSTRALAGLVTVLVVAPLLPAGAIAAEQCVGDPPRQIEDPLGPPCVAWDDVNEGATWKGVDADSVTVVLYNDLGISGDMNAPYDPDDEDPVLQTHFQYRNLVRTVKAHLRYFDTHMQTYGRDVRLFAYPSAGGLATRPEQRRGELHIINGLYDPFAIIFVGGNAQQMFAEAARLDIMSFGTLSDVPRGVYLGSAPFVWSLLPDQETQAALTSGFVCRKLRGGTARHSPDPLLRAHPRTFGLLYEVESQRGPQLEQLAALLEQKLRGCGIELERFIPFVGANVIPAVQEMQLSKVTTLLCYCIPQQSELDVPKAQAAATALGYLPEWVWDPASSMDKAIWQRLHGNPVHAGFGTTSYWRQPGFEQQYHYRAFKQMDPEGSPNVRWSFEIYHAFLTLFSAVQRAGSVLDPPHVQTGMKTWSMRRAHDPFVPSGGFDSTKANPYSFIDTGMAWWWDAIGTEPGAPAPTGCTRVANDGLRFAAHTWPPGDLDLYTADGPCTVAPIGLLEP